MPYLTRDMLGLKKGDEVKVGTEYRNETVVPDYPNNHLLRPVYNKFTAVDIALMLEVGLLTEEKTEEIGKTEVIWGGKDFSGTPMQTKTMCLRCTDTASSGTGCLHGTRTNNEVEQLTATYRVNGSEEKWEPKDGDVYYTLRFSYDAQGGIELRRMIWENAYGERQLLDKNLAFPTESAALAKAEEIRKVLKK